MMMNINMIAIIMIMMMAQCNNDDMRIVIIMIVMLIIVMTPKGIIQDFCTMSLQQELFLALTLT